MTRRTGHRFAVVCALTASLVLSGPDLPVRADPDALGCRQSMSTLTAMRSGLTFPPQFGEPNPTKSGGEFDPNRYFQAFPHLSLRDSYTLDFVYHQDGMGATPSSTPAQRTRLPTPTKPRTGRLVRIPTTSPSSSRRTVRKAISSTPRSP